MWRHYFADIPLWTMGFRGPRITRRIARQNEAEAAGVRQGFERLCRNLGRSAQEEEMRRVVEEFFLVKTVAEGDAYAPLCMTGGNLKRRFPLEGEGHLAGALTEERPIVLLSGHTGTFTASLISLLPLGRPVYMVARKFVWSSEDHPARQSYLAIYHRLLNLRFPVRFLYSDLSGSVDRSLQTALSGPNIVVVFIDLPLSLYPFKRMPVPLFGRPSSLPSGFVRWALRKKARFFTAWSIVARDADGRLDRILRIGPPFPDTDGPGEIIRGYAESLSALVADQPWQWMELPVIGLFDEGSQGE